MLVYIKTEEISRIFDPIVESSVPKWVIEEEEGIFQIGKNYANKVILFFVIRMLNTNQFNTQQCQFHANVAQGVIQIN